MGRCSPAFAVRWNVEGGTCSLGADLKGTLSRAVSHTNDGVTAALDYLTQAAGA